MTKKVFTHLSRNLSYDELLVENSSNGRTYCTPDGRRYPSITTVLSILGKEAIVEWQNRVGIEEANRISRKAASRGTNLHLVAEKYLDNKDDYLKGQMPHIVELFRSIQPILDTKVDNIHLQEKPLYSDHFQIAGRVDCIAEFEGELAIIDYKTSGKQKQEEWISSYFMQTAFYAAAYYERTGIVIKNVCIIMAVEGDNPQVFLKPAHPWLKPLLKVRNEFRKQKNI